MTDNKTLQELEAYHARLITDVRRSQALDPSGLNHHTPLLKNLRKVEEQIRAKKQGK
jgi:hypothetical protein